MRKTTVTALLIACACFCSPNAYSQTSETIQTEKSEKILTETEKRNAEYVIPTYAPNNEITGEYDESLAVKCFNGIFVGKKREDVNIWKGIPFCKQPVGELRFKEPQPAEASNKVYEAYNFMKSCLQSIDPDEKASYYEQGEDCLGLNIWTNTKSSVKAKPVLVFIHGGGWVAGGTSDPLYNGYYFAHDNPDIVLVTIDYRVGMMGQINLSSLPDGKDYKNSEDLCMLDMIESLKWIKQNIAAFGGDPDNITISGESAGGGAVSMLCVMKEAKGLFSKAIPMSGAVTHFSKKELTLKQVPAIQEAFGCKTVADINKIPFDQLKKWWGYNASGIYHHPARGNNLIEADPLNAWVRGDSKDIIILQGHTAKEFNYYYTVYAYLDEMFDTVCEAGTKGIVAESGKEFSVVYEEYNKILEKLGYKGNDLYREFMNDKVFNAPQLYQAEMHSKNGGKGYFYIFDKSYDGEYAKIGAGHAVDLNYLFGTFDGISAYGTPEELKLASQYQQMIVNFCKTGNPSIEGLEWPEYNLQTRTKMIIGDNTRVEENYETERNTKVMQMMEISDAFRFPGTEGTLFDRAAAINPKAAEECKKIWAANQELDK